MRERYWPGLLRQTAEQIARPPPSCTLLVLSAEARVWVFRGDRCAAGGIVWRPSSARLSSAHVRLPSRDLRAADESGHSAEPFTEVTFVRPGPETDLQRTEGPTKQSGALTVRTKYREE